MMGVAFQELQKVHAFSGADGEFHAEGLLDSEFPADPVGFCRSQTNAGLSLLTRHFGIRGYATAVHTACASGGQAVGAALKVMRRGYVDFVLAGGYDSMLTPIGLSAFCLLEHSRLITTHLRAPAGLSTRPVTALCWAKGRDSWSWRTGMRPGGAGPHLRGVGRRRNSLSSYRITDSHPSGDGPIQAMRQALADAELTPASVDYVNAHGTSTLMNDRSECAALRVVLGEYTERVAVSSTKSCMGT